MAHELTAALLVTFFAGFVLGITLTKLYSKFGTMPVPEHQPKNATMPAEVWISRAGESYHLDSKCPSLHARGKPRPGAAEFKVCAHCLKKGIKAE